MLYINDLTKKYGNFVAVNHLNLHIPQGDLFGFVGPNGAGKTTTIRVVCGLMKCNHGDVIINGINARKHPKEIKRRIGYVPDFFGVYDNFKVKEYMEFFGSMYGLTYREMDKLTDDLLALVNLTDKKENYVDGLSRGMKQRLCVARALIHNPDLLILDEPSSGLDPRARIEMKELLMNLQSMGKTIIISSHILSELSEMCNAIGIMNHGNLVAAGRIEDIQKAVGADAKVIIEVMDQDIERATRLLAEQINVKVESVRERQIIIKFDGDDMQMGGLIAMLIQNQILVTGFHKEQGSLENLFMQLTGGNTNEA